jgi:hypothetical protein
MRELHLKHGWCKSPEYAVWATMKARCSNPKNKSYKDYGGRGIKVSRRWLGKRGFENFIADMGPRPGGTYPSGVAMYTIDRKDNDGPYSPMNCVWATLVEQWRHKRNTKQLEAFGEILSAAEWSRRLGIRAGAIRLRIARGWSVEDALRGRRQPDARSDSSVE